MTLSASRSRRAAAIERAAAMTIHSAASAAAITAVIASGADAYAKIRAGASLVQLYSALVFEGPGLVQRIKRELAQCLRRDGFSSLSQAVGAASR